jgi:tetratricopeptide (TPR) repeat protein
VVDEHVYLRLYRELNASRFDSPDADAAVEQLGAPARVIRGLAKARRHLWAGARADLRAAIEARELAPIVEFVAGVALFVARDYDRSLITLARAAARGKPGIAKQARLYGRSFAERLGWAEEAREFAAAGSPLDPSPELTELPGDDPRPTYLRARELMQLGQFSRAGDLLEQARVMLPRSPAIGLALALARHWQAPTTSGEGLERRFEDLLDWAPGLLADAASELGIELWTDCGVPVEREIRVEILTRADSLLIDEVDLARPSYRCRSHDGTLRLRQVLPLLPLDGATPLARLHEHDRKLLEHVDVALVRALSIKPPRPESPDRSTLLVSTKPAVWKPRHLSPEQIEQFLADGFLVVPRAFDPDLARAWREDANRRIREEPERWVRDYDPHDPSHSLRDYSPDDPSTWSWERIELDGPQTVVIEEFAPSVWATICDLLGGPDRIKTRTWTNYLILNLCEDAWLGIDVPHPSWGSWHLDDPSPLTRIDRIRNGLIGITLCDRLLPRSGNTWLALDSVAKVARELAAHPEGVDFVTRRGNWITVDCERFHEVVGEAGDVLLMHPLMLHSAAPNRSGRIRWMGNPMVYVEQPLDPFRPVEELSPVELAIHRAIRS